MARNPELRLPPRDGPQTGLLLLIILSFLTGCAATITRDTLLKQMQEGAQPLIVDVRSRGEYERDRIPGAIHIPFYSVRSGLEELQFPKDKTLVLYCEHGPRAGISGFLLYLTGYEQLYSLEGHMKGWRENHFPVESPAP